jgi:DNA-binding response OmpR family regulator
MQESFTILVTDTNRHVRDLLRRELASEGHEVQVARDGKELIALLRAGSPPDLLILDPELQDAGGLAVQKSLREGHCSIPVVIHGFSGEFPAGAALLTAGAAFVEKTENTDVLKHVVRTILGQYHATRCQVESPGGEDGESREETE